MMLFLYILFFFVNSPISSFSPFQHHPRHNQLLLSDNGLLVNQEKKSASDHEELHHCTQVWYQTSSNEQIISILVFEFNQLRKFATQHLITNFQQPIILFICW
jgi:hypothetical protein